MKPEDMRAELIQKILDKKIQKTIPEVFTELKKQAAPRVLPATSSLFLTAASG